MSETPACSKCQAALDDPGKVSFLGFRKIVCRRCRAVTTFPLTPGYRITYVVVLALMILVGMQVSAQGQTPMPGFIGIAVVVALVYDLYLRMGPSR